MAEGITIKVNDSQVKKALAGAIKATGNLTPAMKAIGEHLLLSTEENFAGEHDPDDRSTSYRKPSRFQSTPQ